MVYEADSHGIHPTRYENWKKRNDKIFLLDIKERYETFDLMMNKVGKKYDFLGLLRHLGKWTNWKRSKNDAERMFCYEYLGYCFKLPNWYKLRPIDVEKNMIEL
jgi:hypothetical protein